MRIFLSVLCVVVIALAASPSAQASRISEEVDNRLAEMIKWFEARIPIYDKANFLLKKLGTDVARLSDMHGGIDFYYQGSSDLQYFSGLATTARKEPLLRVVKVSDGEVDMKPVENLVRKALEKRTVKNILQLSPEIKSAFAQIMTNKKQ